MTIDYTEYCELCRRAVKDPAVFATFRRQPEYTQVLEHVTAEQGLSYLDQLGQVSLKQRAEWVLNDSVGSPIVVPYLGVGSGEAVSPTTLRYAKNVLDLEKLFSNLDGARIVEIGGGYGGLARLVKACWPKCNYTIIDLPEPLALAEKYLNALNTDVNFVDAFKLPQRVSADLFISNYALSELQRRVIELYVSSVALNCPRGYISANAAESFLPNLLGPLGVRRQIEVPLTGPNNYMLVWGTSVEKIVEGDPMFRSFGELEDETEMPPFGSIFEPYSVPLHLLERIAKSPSTESTIFIETGFYRGMSTSIARTLFDTVISVELSETLWRKGVERFATDPGISILHGDSGTLLPEILSSLNGRRATLWLDAHYSGGETSMGSVTTAIVAELKALAGASRRDHNILIDDLLSFGSDGYPTAEELVALVLQINPAYRIRYHGALRRGILEATL